MAVRVDPAVTAIACAILCILAAARLSGGIYEMIVLDRAWPSNPEIIKPQSGGADRKGFWITLNALFDCTLIGTLWLAWHSRAQDALLAALALYSLMRVWSLTYFIPVARAIEQGALIGSDLDGTALLWVRRNRFRVTLDFGTLIAASTAATALWSVRP